MYAVRLIYIRTYKYIPTHAHIPVELYTHIKFHTYTCTHSSWIIHTSTCVQSDWIIYTHSNTRIHTHSQTKRRHRSDSPDQRRLEAKERHICIYLQFNCTSAQFPAFVLSSTVQIEARSKKDTSTYTSNSTVYLEICIELCSSNRQPDNANDKITARTQTAKFTTESIHRHRIGTQIQNYYTDTDS